MFERLRAWRRGRAEADGVPVYVVLNNAQLLEIARRRPTSPAAFRAIEGIGESKAGRYGADILQAVAATATDQPQRKERDGDHS